jgi:hypothetical protein
MPELAILLPLAAFIALAAGLFIVFRRTDTIARRSRELETFKAAVRELSVRIDTSLEGATSRIDAVRRQQIPAETVAPTIEAATDAVQRYVGEVRALTGPPPAITIRDALVADLERADRALQMVDHGATILAQVRRRGRELEAQTSLKRGYLNLMHARDAVQRHAAEARALEIVVDPAETAARSDSARERPRATPPRSAPPSPPPPGTPPASPAGAAGPSSAAQPPAAPGSSGPATP